MKGLEVARAFFHEWGLVYLRSEFPEISERVAGVLCGSSQSLGHDDELSRDHGWGPGFSLILTSEDMRRYGRQLRKLMQKEAPRIWRGYEWRGESNVTVDPIDKWFRQNIGCAQPPKTSEGWLSRTLVNNLYMLRHATVFHDPLGQFSERQKSFWFYPRGAWFESLSTEVFHAWHYGQYNFLERLVHRNDPISNKACLGSFIQGSLRVFFLAERDYFPYWKWLAAEFRKLPNVAEVESWYTELSLSTDIEKQAELVDAICKEVYSRLFSKGLVSEKPSGHEHPLSCAREELQRKASAEE